jgi:predicted TPR repeat methyltransferase
MGILEKKRGALSRAKVFFRKALDINPSDGHAIVQLASISQDDGDDIDVAGVTVLDPEYVSALFDGYSSRFESELVDVLMYRGHSLVYEALRNALTLIGKKPSSVQTILDLGCGTGLLGELIANDLPWVAIYGTDLSQRMVDISLERKTDSGRRVYTSVGIEDASQNLSTFDRESVDCVVASDVFIYIGDISNVLDESSKCLVKDGLVGFTVESYEPPKTDDSGLRLLPSGRFGHTKEYIERVAQGHGFEVLSWKDCVLRQQSGKDVNGAAVILKKL